MRPMLSSLVLFVALALVAGCEEQTKKPCPAKGLGVVSTLSGKTCEGILDPADPDVQDCQDQMRNYRDYDCTELQVCPDHGAHQIPGFVFSPKTAPESLAFTLTNCSVGNQQLTINKVEVLGDPNCHFKFDPSKDIKYATESPGAKSGETIFLQAVYDPQKLGQDHAQLRVRTNATNFPVLRLPICARAVAEFKPGADSGPLGLDGAPAGDSKPKNDWYVPVWRCQDVGETIAPCHSQQTVPDAGQSADAGQ